MTRAEEAALKAYPEEITVAYGPLPGASGPCEFDDNQPYRIGFIKGYEQAEKDLVLTWEDIKEIQRLLDVVWSEQDITAPIDEDSSIYPKVLKRFKEEKK